jgi:uncharacterized protein YhaN
MPRAKAGPKKLTGKWAHLIGKLPKLNEEDPKDQEIIEKLKEKMINEHMEAQKEPPTLGYLVEKYMDARHYKETLERELKDTELEISAILQMVEVAYEAQGIRSLRLPDGSSLGFHYEPKAVVIDPAAHRRWAIQNGLAEELTLPWSKTNSLLKKALEEQTAVYDGEKVVGGPDGVQAHMVVRFRKNEGDD